LLATYYYLMPEKITPPIIKEHIKIRIIKKFILVDCVITIENIHIIRNS